MSKHTIKDFVYLIPKESICSIVIGECGVVVKTKVVDLKKLYSFVVHNFFV